MKEKCIIIGAGTYGQIYAVYLRDDYEIVGFIDDNSDLKGQIVNGIKVLGNFEHLLEEYDTATNVFLTIGNNEVRERLLTSLKQKGFKTPNFIHPSTDIDESVIIADRAVYVLQGTIIMPLAELKEGVVIGAGSFVAHHTTVGAGAFISSGVNLGASVNVKRKAYLGIGCTVMTGVKTIGERSLIGAGSVIISDVADSVTVVGNPGRVIKSRGV